MNSIAIHFMLNARNICVLLCIFVAHLGCSSSYRNQMEKVSGDTTRPSGSKRARVPSLGEGDSHVQLVFEKVNKFLHKEEEDQEGKKMRKVFEKGSPVTDEEIKLVVHRLGRSENVFNVDNIDKAYKEFLNTYGSIDGAGFDIYGPSACIGDHDGKIEEILLIQKGFENRCRKSRMKAERVKSCWLIAGIDQGDEYYMDLSVDKKENIYSMSPNGKSKLFAKDFLEFLDKFLETYERRSEEEAYQEEAYKSEDSD